MSAHVTAPPAVPPRSFAPREYRLEAEEFARIASLLHQAAGINLTPNKMEMVQSRLGRRLRALGLSTFSQYLDAVAAPDGADEHRRMVNALTTNLTHFFREKHHFDYLGDAILPELARNRVQNGARLRIWSAGCSSGEEPYSIAMTICDRLPDWQRWDAKVLATDIDTNMVATGDAGCYDVSRADAVPESYRRRFLIRNADATLVEIAPPVRSLVAFRQLNLLGAWPMRGRFDVIFCRNVIIYFDKPTQQTLFDRFANILAPNGWLIIGHSETLFRISNRFEHLGHTVYRKTA